MKARFLFIPTVALSVMAASFSASLLGGCAGTAAGLKEDVSRNTSSAREEAARAGAAARRAEEKAKEVPENIGASVGITPIVKAAIVRDPVLNDPHNLINVESKDKVVYLKGHVADASMKQRATEDAQVALRKHPKYTVQNQLAVNGAS